MALPLLLFTTTLRVTINSPSLYQWGFQRQNSSTATGLTQAQLKAGAEGLIAYFNSAQEPSHILVSGDGQGRELFNPREVAHLTDVKRLILGVYRFQEATLAYATGYTLLMLLLLRRRGFRLLAEDVLVGSGATLGLFVLLGAALTISFDQLFLQFHLVSFDNPFWMLDPSRDIMIRMFPPGFFADAALLIAGGTIAEALVLGSGALLYLRKEGERRL